MATPAPSQRPSNTPGPSAASWSRSGEPGSVFSGLSRGGRGRGSARGRSGRGGRGGPRETRVIGADPSSDKPIMTTSKLASSPSTKPMASPPHVPTTTEKAPVVPNAPSSTRSKRDSRRAPRSIPVVVVPPVSTDAPSNLGSSKPASRRRRSQTGKTTQTLTKVNVSSHDDHLLRPQRPRTGSVPHTVPIKDAPPHLTNNPINKHTDVDVDREPTVHVNYRSSTPGSHIDWAGDDDDSLPDLDDWGITSIKATGNGLISPLGVSGLTPLPDILTDAETPLPQKTNSESTNDARTTITTHQVKSQDDGMSDVNVAAPIITTQEPLVSAPASAKVSICPSLPPDAADVTKQAEVAPKDNEISAPVAEAERGLAPSIHSPDTNADKEDPFSNLLARNGLAASIHAPQPADLTESKSAPSDISLHSRASPERWTHTRSHPIGRPPPYPRANNNSRPSRSGYNTPRGGSSGGGRHHARTHSTPPTSSHTHRSPAHRPVITGDAISRLVKTIGSTTLSPARVPATSAAQE